MMKRFVCLCCAGVLLSVAGQISPQKAYRSHGRFSGEHPAQRASVDIPFKVDLSRARAVTFDLTVSNMTQFSSFTCFFKSGKGWYATTFSPGREGERKRIAIGKGDINVEQCPGGWRSVDTMRISGWRGGNQDASFVVSNIQVEVSSPEVVILQAQSCFVRRSNERKSCVDFAGHLDESLKMTGLSVVLMSDSDLDESSLEGVNVVMLPYNPSLPDHAVKVLSDFVARGGRLFAAYACDARVLEFVGVESRKWMPAPGGRFGGFVRNGEGLAGQPEFARQGSWATMDVAVKDGAQVLAYWGDRGTPSKWPALVRGKHGIYMGHVWLGLDAPDAQALMSAVMGELFPACKERFAAAVRAFEAAKQADEKWAASLPASRQPEFRGFWCHSALGLGGEHSWDTSIALLKRHGFNAMLANLAWGGVAYYPSQVLPRASVEADTFAACQAACRKHGIAFHVWKVCWNLGRNAPKAFLETLRKEGRLQVDLSGNENPWLCPSHPENLKLEVEAFVELAKKGADGIHFDYVRYPSSNTCFCRGCRTRFEERYGRVEGEWPKSVRKNHAASWAEFRSSAISDLVRTVAQRVRKEAPGVQISAAVFENARTTRESVGQDWTMWCKEGWLDFVCPMDYTPSTEIFSGMISRQKGITGKVPVYPGIGLSASGVGKRGRLRRVAEQIVECRKAGFSGFTVFNFDTTAQEVLPYISLGLTRE